MIYKLYIIIIYKFRMNVLLNKIFLEQNQIRFGDLCNTLTDYFDDHHVDYSKYHSLTDSEGSTVSTFSLGLIAVLKTFSNSSNTNNQRIQIENYVNNLITILNKSKYEHVEPSIYSIFSSINSFFNYHEKEEEKEYFSQYDRIKPEVIPYVISDRFDNSKYSDFNYIDKFVSKIFSYGRYHEDYMLIFSVITFTFTTMIEDYPNRSELFAKFLVRLIEVDKIAGKHGFYDKCNSRVYIKF